MGGKWEKQGRQAGAVQSINVGKLRDSQALSWDKSSLSRFNFEVTCNEDEVKLESRGNINPRCGESIATQRTSWRKHLFMRDRFKALQVRPCYRNRSSCITYVISTKLKRRHMELSRWGADWKVRPYLALKVWVAKLRTQRET